MCGEEVLHMKNCMRSAKAKSGLWRHPLPHKLEPPSHLTLASIFSPRGSCTLALYMCSSPPPRCSCTPCAGRHAPSCRTLPTTTRRRPWPT